MGHPTSPPPSQTPPHRPTPLRTYAWASGAMAVAACGVVALALLPQAMATKPFAAMGLGAVLLGLSVLALRLMLKRMQTLQHLGDVLAAWSHDEPDLEALRLTASTDPTSANWNRLIDELAESRQTARHAKAYEQLTQPATRAADHDGAFDALPHGVVVVNPDALITAVNGAASRMLMRSRDRLVGAPIDKVIPEESLGGLIRNVLADPTSRGGTVEIQLNPGENEQAIIRATVRPVGQAHQQRSALIYFEDLTQQRTADQSRNLFVAQATHELRTPLTNISLYLERAIDLDEHETADRAECLNVINQEVLRLGRVVEEVLSVSEIEAGSLKVRRDDVRPDDIIRSLEHEYAPQAKDKSITLTFDLPPKLSVVQGDREKITLALHNLLGNALKYTPAGGQVGVQLLEHDGHIKVHVTDTGIGINDHELAKVFEKFYRADDSRLQNIGGSGLGLALARDVIRLHGGDITVESEINQGSTFTLTLPINAAVGSRT